MKRLSSFLIYFFSFWLCASTVNAQVGSLDSAVLVGSSTLLKIRPMTLLYGALSFAIEQTISKRSSVELEVTQSVGNGRFVRVFGHAKSLAASFRYYPLANQAAPQGLYVGANVSYSRLRNSDLLRLITLFTTTGNDISSWSAQGLAGYQYCTRQNIVLDARGSLAFFNRVTYYEGSLSGQSGTQHQVNAVRLLPGLTLSVGYRFRHRRR